MALQVQPAASKKSAEKAVARKFRFPLPGQSASPGSTERMFFTEQLALLLETGESLHGALRAIARQTENPKMQIVVEKITQDISEGRTFAAALEQHDTVFSSTYVNLIAASETGGFMHDVLLQLLEMDKKREVLHSTLVSAATYPMFLIAFSLAVVIFVLVVVFPKFEAMFSSIYDQLPVSTRALMQISSVLREYWMLVLGCMFAAMLAIRYWLASENGARRIDYLKLHMPGLRGVFTHIYLTQSLQVMGLSLANGVSVVDSLNSCRDVVRNLHFRNLISSIEGKVQSGGGVAAGFASADFVPDLAKHMIATGEQSGKLGAVMIRIAEYYSAKLEKRLEMLSKLAEPIMLLVMGVIVGVLVSSLILPIFKLSRAVA